MAEYTICLAFTLFVLAYTSDVTGTKLTLGTFGRDFYIGVLKPYRFDINGDVSLIITSANNSNGQVNVHAPYLGMNTTRSFSSLKNLQISISSSIIQSKNTEVERRGIRVTSDIDVSVLVISPPNGKYEDSRESFIALPNNMLSNAYVISSYNATSSWDSEFLILATENSTTVNITNSRNFSTTSVYMNSMDTHISSSRVDLSGTIVSSDKPVAVFSGHEAAGVACNYNHYLVEQLLPTKLFDHQFIVPPLPPKSGYVVRVYASEGYTTLNYTFSTINESRVLVRPGQFHEIIGNSEPIIISTDKPTQVMLYSTCKHFGGDSLGDGTMSIVPSTNQYDTAYYFTIPSIFDDTDHYLAIMSNDITIESGLQIDGRSMWNKRYEYNVTTLDATYFVYIYKLYRGTHKLEQLNGHRFGALVYGYGSDGIAYSNILGLHVSGCDGLPSPSNGKVTLLKDTTHLSLATYSCLHGYLLQGSPTRTCDSSGQWNGIMPACVAIDCGSPASLDNADIRTRNGTTYGNQAEYICNHGYILQGQRSRICNADGRWSGMNPTCQPADCGSPVSPINGNVSTPNGTDYLHQAEYTCFKGYALQGERLRKCNAFGQWSGTTPICEAIDLELTCLKCTNVHHTNLCSTITKCSPGQVCFVEKFTTHEGSIRYNSGCLESKQCHIGLSGVGKRSVDCINCCNSDLCNFAGCGSQGLPARAQRGPLCYDCALTYNMSECNTISLCKPYEVCSVEKYDWGGLYDKYTTECKDSRCLSSNSRAMQSSAMTRSTPVCQSCCEEDLCNSSCNVTTQNGNGIAIIG